MEKVKISKKIKKKSNHNGIISFWKFMFAIMIVIYHFNLGIKYEKAILRNGYIGVEFFFIVSGYLMTKKALNKKEGCLDIGYETFQYILKKIKGFFPFMLVAFSITLFINAISKGYSLGSIANSIWNLFFLETSGIKTTLVIGQTWYISAMLIAMLILYPLIRRYKKNFVYLIAPVIVIFIGGWISHNYGTLNGWQYTGVVYKCLLRAFFELALGAILYEISTKMRDINFNKFGSIILTLIEILGFIVTFVIANKTNSKYDFIVLALISISVIIAFSEKTIFYNLTNNKFFYYLEKLSLPIYLNHQWVMNVIGIVKRKLNYLNYWQELAIDIFFTIVFSIIIAYIMEKVRGKSIKVTKKLFILEK